MSKRRTRGRTTGRSSWYCVATRATNTAPPQSGHVAAAAARWVRSTRAGRRRHACRPYCAPGRRPGRPPRPWGRSLAKGAACRNPARRAASSCFLRRALRRFHRSRSRSTRVNSSRSPFDLSFLFPNGRIAGTLLGRRTLRRHHAVMPHHRKLYKYNFVDLAGSGSHPENEYKHTCVGSRSARRDGREWISVLDSVQLHASFSLQFKAPNGH